MSTPSVAPYDVVVVGARPAGAATALVLARAGLRILVVDRGIYGADTVSPHASSAVRCCSSLYAPRRTVLDPILVDAARDAGAEVRFGVAVTELRRDGNGRSPRHCRHLPHQPRPDLCLRRHFAPAVPTRIAAGCGIRLHTAPGPGCPGGARRGRRRPRAAPGVRRAAARVTPPSVRAWVGVGRRRRLRQGPDHRPRPHRRPPRRRALGSCNHRRRRREAPEAVALAAYQATRDRLSERLSAVTDANAIAWDLDEIRRLLLQLSDAMSDEVWWLRALEPISAAA